MMNTGKYRSDIVDQISECNNEIVESVIGTIDNIEQELSNILENFNIGGVEDLYKIEDAKRELEELKDKLW